MPLIQQGHAGFHLCLTQKLLEVGQKQQDLRADRQLNQVLGEADLLNESSHIGAAFKRYLDAEIKEAKEILLN